MHAPGCCCDACWPRTLCATWAGGMRALLGRLLEQLNTTPKKGFV